MGYEEEWASRSSQLLSRKMVSLARTYLPGHVCGFVLMGRYECLGLCDMIELVVTLWGFGSSVGVRTWGCG